MPTCINRETADHLFVSVRTVENHLRRVYMKLGVSGRRELADVVFVPGRSPLTADCGVVVPADRCLPCGAADACAATSHAMLEEFGFPGKIGVAPLTKTAHRQLAGDVHAPDDVITDMSGGNDDVALRMQRVPASGRGATVYTDLRFADGLRSRHVEPRAMLCLTA